MTRKLNTRAAAARLSWQIIDKGQSLDAVIGAYNDSVEMSSQDRGFIQELVYGVCRWYGELDVIAASLLRSPIRNKDRVIHFVLLVGLYQLSKLNTAKHAAVSETVSACRQLNKQWAKQLINGCLRSYQRIDSKDRPVDPLDSHPQWLYDALAKAWPKHFKTILQANNQHPPMCLRVNSLQSSRTEYLTQLEKLGIASTADAYCKDGIVLQQAVAVNVLPGFETGACSVQDSAAQIAADIVAVEPNMVVLDACAAPGGKTAHLLERADNQLEMHALDISKRRCEQLHSTLARLRLDATVSIADTAKSHDWDYPANGYDRILIDAPCSGVGVIRRHPDIKHHRRPSDVESLQKVQAQLLENLWPLLKSKGRLLYMTCSVLPQENLEQIRRFVEQHNDAILLKPDHPHAIELEYGVQTLPGVHNMDGFYYCLLEKSS